LKCTVCGRGKNTVAISNVVIDGVACTVCSECGGDPFRRKRAVEIAQGKPRSCDCGRCASSAQRGRA